MATSFAFAWLPPVVAFEAARLAFIMLFAKLVCSFVDVTTLDTISSLLAGYSLEIASCRVTSDTSGYGGGGGGGSLGVIASFLGGVGGGI